MEECDYRLPLDAKIHVAGHRGLVGSAIVRRLRALGRDNLVLRTHAELDLTDQAAVAAFYQHEHPDYVILAAAKVGGIHANDTYPAEFIAQNLQIQTNVIDGAWRAGVQRLLFLGSSCIYPKLAPQPMREEHLLTGPLEPTNEPYAVAKIAGIKMCEAYNRQYGTRYFSVMPTNLYGPGDNFDLANSHVMPALMRKFHEARLAGEAEVPVWGSGNPRREFLHVDDMADACVFLLGEDSCNEMVNIGVGEDLTIRELAEMVAEAVGFEGKLHFDSSMPDGTPRKLLDVSRLYGYVWRARIGLREGIADTYRWFLENQESFRR